MPRIAHIEIRSDPPQVAGSIVRYRIPPQDRGAWSATHALNGESRGQLSLPTDAEAWAHVRRLDCIRVVYVDGTARSWRVFDDALSEDAQTGLLTLTVGDVVRDLTYARILRNEATAGEPQLARTFAAMTPAEILTDVLYELHDAGVAEHIRLGVVEPTALIPHDRTWATPLEVVRAVASHSRIACEYRLREEADAFYLDLLYRVGGSADPVHVWYQGDLGTLNRQRSASQVASVVIPRGDGADVTCGATVLEVVDVAAGYIRVRDPDAPDAPPIVFDDQYVGSYVVRPVDGSPRRVLASSAETQDLYLTGASGFTVGDLFEFRRDASGNRLVTRENPAAARARHLGGIGRVERFVPVADAPYGQRNYVRNPFFRDWSAAGSGVLVPTGWTTVGGYNTRQLDAPEAPSGVSLLLRPYTSVTVIAEIAAGARDSTQNSGAACSAIFRIGEQWEIRNQSNNALRHTVTVTAVSVERVYWAEAAPELYTAGTVKLVLKAGGAGAVNGGASITASRIYPPADVRTVSIGAHVYAPSLASNRRVEFSARRNGTGAWTTIAAPEKGAWQTLSHLGVAHNAGDFYDLRITQAHPVEPFQAPNRASLFGEVAWVYVGEGAELPPHDLAGGQFHVPEFSNSNRVSRVGQAALLRLAPDRARYAIELADFLGEDGSAVAADRFTLGGTVVVHHDRLEVPVRARLLTITEREDEPESPQLTLDSTEPNVARTLALLLGASASGSRASATGVLSGPWPITVVASPDNGGLVSGGGRYVTGRPVEARAVAQPNFLFTGWRVDGVLVSTSPAYDFTASEARVLVAEFAAVPTGTYTITATVSPSGAGSVSGTGVKTSGAAVSLVATPAAGYGFVRWTDGGTPVSTNPTYNFTASANRTLVAEFAPVSPGTSTITASVSPVGTGSVAGAGSHTNGELATLSATPAAGYRFLRWTEGGAVVSTSTPLIFTVAGARTLVAEFELIPTATYAITASVAPSGTGSVAGAGTYAPDASVTLTATPATGHRFVRWTEGGTPVGITQTLTFTASANRTLVAEFELIPPGPWTISATSAPSAWGDIIGISNPYPDGSTVSLTAVPVGARTFVRWTEGGVEISTSTSLTFTAASHRSLVAEFA